jgi:hypothetical protein
LKLLFLTLASLFDLVVGYVCVVVALGFALSGYWPVMLLSVAYLVGVVIALRRVGVRWRRDGPQGTWEYTARRLFFLHLVCLPVALAALAI